MASNIKGITIEIGGNTTGLTNALKDVDKQLSSTQKELKEVDKGLKLDPTNVTLLTQKQTLLSNAINQTSERLATLKRAKEQADATGNVDKNSEQYRALQREIETATQKLNGFKQQQEQVNTSLSNTSKGMDFGNVSEKITALSTGFMAVQQVATAVVNVVKQVGQAIIEVGAKADDINTLAKQFGMTTEQVQIFQKSADLIDVDFDTIASAYKKLTMNLDSDSMVEQLNAIGVAVRDSSGEYRDINDIFNDTIKGLSKVTNETEKDTIANNIFGKSASELAGLIDDGGASLEQFAEYLEANNLIMDQDTLDSLNSMNDAYDTLGVTLDSVGDQFLSQFSGPMSGFLEWLNGEIPSVVEWVTNAFTTIKEWYDEHLAPLLNDLYDFFITYIMPALEALWDCWSTYLSIAFDALVTVLGDVFDWLSGLWTFLEDIGVIEAFGKAFQTVATIIQGVADAAKKAYNWIKKVIEKIKEWLGLGGEGASVAAEAGLNGYYDESGYSSKGFGVPSLMASNGFASSGHNITTNVNFTVNGSTTNFNARLYAQQIAEYINDELGRKM